MVSHHKCEAVNPRQMRGAVNHARCVEQRYDTTTRSWRKKFTTFQTYFQNVAFLISPNILPVRWTRTRKITSRPWSDNVHSTRRPTPNQMQPQRTPRVQIKSGSAYAGRVTPDQNKFRIHTQARYRSNRDQRILLASFDQHTHHTSRSAPRSLAMITVTSSSATDHVTTFYDVKTSA